MKHFLAINDLSQQQVEGLLQRALYFKQQQKFPAYPQCYVANLFYENSTRTRISFEMAARHLSMGVIHVDIASSSEAKGEVIADTVKTLAAMGISVFAIRHSSEYLPEFLAKTVGDEIHIINAGDGQHAHPSQAMLDLMTIVEKKPDLEKLKIALVGDIRHSRVANSLQQLFRLMGVRELVLVAPEALLPEKPHWGQVTSQLAEGLAQADVVIGLRVQKERLKAEEHLDLKSYIKNYSLTREAFSWAKPDALIMHPGPLNRGIEIESDLADGPQSMILTQVKNGVYMRMAILEALASV